MRPDLPLARGLSARFERLEGRRPLLYRALALAGLTLSVAGGTACQVRGGRVTPTVGACAHVLLLLASVPARLPSKHLQS